MHSSKHVQIAQSLHAKCLLDIQLTVHQVRASCTKHWYRYVPEPQQHSPHQNCKGS